MAFIGFAHESTVNKMRFAAAGTYDGVYFAAFTEKFTELYWAEDQSFDFDWYLT